jgi:hypothetical protein
MNTKDHGIGLSSHIKDRELCDQLSCYQILEEDPAPWSWFIHFCWLCTTDVIKFCCMKLLCMLGCKYILSSVCLLFILTHNLHFCPRGRWGLVLHTYFHMLMVNTDDNNNRSCTGCAASPGLSKISCLSLMSER